MLAALRGVAADEEGPPGHARSQLAL